MKFDSAETDSQGCPPSTRQFRSQVICGDRAGQLIRGRTFAHGRQAYSVSRVQERSRKRAWCRLGRFRSFGDVCPSVRARAVAWPTPVGSENPSSLRLPVGSTLQRRGRAVGACGPSSKRLGSRIVLRRPGEPEHPRHRKWTG
jgi:hypothetical protein